MEDARQWNPFGTELADLVRVTLGEIHRGGGPNPTDATTSLGFCRRPPTFLCQKATEA